MKRNVSMFMIILFLSTLFLAGCGSSSHSKSPDSGAKNEDSQDIEPNEEPGEEPNQEPNITLNLEAASAEYPNAKLLVSADSLKKSLGASKLVIIDARPKAAYDLGHIKGAINLIHNEFWTWGSGLKPVADLQTMLGAVGLSRDMTYVIYDNTTASWGAAGRIFWMLEYLGCKDGHILDGGWDKWPVDGNSTETTINILPTNTFVAKVNSEVIVKQEHILSRLNDNDFAVIDARTDEEYNGWQFYGEARGGHIPGAVNIPYAWYFYPDKTTLRYDDLREMFESRGITFDKEVTANCTVGIRSAYVYFLLRLMGYPRCSNYDASIVEWSNIAVRPMDKLPNYSKLVPASWVKDLVDNKTVLNPPAGRYIIVAATSLTEPTTFIPESIWIKATEWELRGKIGGVTYGSGNLWPDATLKANIESWGIDKDTTVIIYSANPGVYDVTIAARLLWALMYAGVSDVRFLNGGIDAWTANGYPVDSTSAERVPVDSFFGDAEGLTFPLHSEYLATTEYVEEVVAGDHPNVILSDIRNMLEYIGGPNNYAASGIPLTAQGRVPGAKWGHWGEYYYWDAADGTLRSYTEVVKMWEDYGITSTDTNGTPNTIVSYCGTAWRSSVAFYYGYLMGWNVKNYDGSFFEWAMTHPNAANHEIESGWPY